MELFFRWLAKFYKFGGIYSGQFFFGGFSKVAKSLGDLDIPWQRFGGLFITRPTPSAIKKCHFIFDYNFGISWSIFILFIPV